MSIHLSFGPGFFLKSSRPMLTWSEMKKERVALAILIGYWLIPLYFRVNLVICPQKVVYQWPLYAVTSCLTQAEVNNTRQLLKVSRNYLGFIESDETGQPNVWAGAVVTVLSARIQVKSHSTVGFFVLFHSLRVTFTNTNNYEILSRALFEKY